MGKLPKGIAAGIAGMALILGCVGTTTSGEKDGAKYSETAREIQAKVGIASPGSSPGS